MLFKIGALKHFVNFTAIHPSESLLKNVGGPQAGNFIIKRLQHKWFPVKFARFFRAPSFTDHLFKVSNNNNLFKDF